MSFKMSFGDIVLALGGTIQNLQKVVSFYHIRLFTILVLLRLTNLLRTDGSPGRSNHHVECFHFKVKSVKTKYMFRPRAVQNSSKTEKNIFTFPM